MYPVINAFFRWARRLFGPVWGIRVANLVFFVYFTAAAITDQGWKRAFAAFGVIVLLGETVLVEWERVHPRPKRRRNLSKVDEENQS
jgi:hypothetical protein